MPVIRVIGEIAGPNLLFFQNDANNTELKRKRKENENTLKAKLTVTWYG